MKIFFSKYVYWNKYNVVFHSDDDGGDIFNCQTPWVSSFVLYFLHAVIEVE